MRVALIRDRQDSVVLAPVSFEVCVGIDRPHRLPEVPRNRHGARAGRVREAAEPADMANEPDAEKDTGTATIEETGSGFTPPKDVIATRLDLPPER